MKRNDLVLLSLRLGLAFVFLYAVVGSFMNPDAWIGYFPKFLTTLVPGNLLLPLFSGYEIVLALWLLSGKKVFIPAAISAATMLGIVVFNLSLLDVTFRDIGLFFAAVALFLATY